jgi:hypothetical protein
MTNEIELAYLVLSISVLLIISLLLPKRDSRRR